MVLPLLLWYAILTVFGALAFGAVRRLGIGAGAAWAVARVAGLVAQAYVAWLAGNLGLVWWWWIGVAPMAVLAWWGFREWKGMGWRHLVEPELIGVCAFLMLAFLRLPTLAVTATEKPMDLAILNTLLRPGTFPPTDPWLSGFDLPYYYWGFMPWVLPTKLSLLAPDAVFNLLVPTLAMVSAQAAWALARSLGGSRRTGIMAAGLVVFTGTLAGWRQWLSGTDLVGLDLWPASRQITGTITEFPLFTFHLGDLHPHLLAVPLMLVAMFLGRALSAHRKQPPAPLLGLTVLVFGAAAAASPWCALPTGLAILLGAVADERSFLGFRGGGWRQWGTVAAIGAGGWLAYSPFWLRFHPPAEGFGLVTAGTRVDQFVLLMGALILPLFLTCGELAWRWGGLDRAWRQLMRATWLAGTVALIVLSRRFVLGLAIGLGAVMLATVLRGKVRPVRPALALALVGLALLALMELIYFKDPYGTEYYRMNTVFKATHMAFVVLAVTAPVLLGFLRRRRPWLAVFSAVVVLAAGLPQLAALGVRAFGERPGSWSGLRWMAEGEPEVVAWLRTQPRGTVLIEAVGDAYSDAARMSASSGVQAVLGWDNHEGVWRGSSINEETGRRRRAVETLYRAADPEQVRTIARELGAHLIVVGSVEERLYPEAGLDAVRGAGPVAFRAGVCTVVRIAPVEGTGVGEHETGISTVSAACDSRLSAFGWRGGGAP
ncbi:MAG: hypothetical protein KA072_07835 [Thermoanaerobaculaceae bacterium]|nr:hypothetical protein [Thermoanaerobaculaceae bacterium]MDI9621961.1 DUF2298 domain-containing protein [Acidobacteriota bacterium]NLH12225.1 hypothetical protein [Holophagae bacterium]HPW55625.1 DUF2298 domain-containing protein [Thermoanaerobaculaceae bacterium]